jgi:hypothetical protein
MAEQIPIQAGAETERPGLEDAKSSLHIASREDAIDAAARDHRLDAILTRGDIRDQAAERRDRKADSRSFASGSGSAGTDREWAGRDRDLAAADRADLVELLHEHQEIGQVTEPVIDLVGGSGGSSDEALAALAAAARGTH